MSADIATLGLRVDASGAITSLREFGATAGLATTEATGLEAAGARLKSAFIGIAGVLGVGLGIKEVTTASVDAQKSFAQLEAGVKSTGAAAGFTAAQLRDMAKSMQDLSGFSHVAIEQTQGIFLLFQSLKGVQFQQATQAAADLAARMGTDVPDAARQLGKALEDPKTGLLMLRRAGIVFTEQQTEQIKAMVASGDLMKAQTTILDLVTQKVGGSAAAYRDTLGGALSNLKNQFVDFIEVTKGGSSGVITLLNAIASGVEGVTALTGGLAGLVTAAEAVAAVYAGRAVASLVAYNATLVASSVVSAEAIVVDIRRAEVAVAAAEAQRISAVANLELTTQALATNEATAASQIAALTGVQMANARAALAADGLAVATARSSIALTLGAQAAGLWSKALALVGGPIGALILAAWGLNTAIDKMLGSFNALIDAEDRDSAAKAKAFMATNAHIKAMQEAAAARAKIATDEKAALTERQKLLADALAQDQKTIDENRANLLYQGQHVDLLTREIQSTNLLTLAKKQLTDAIDAETLKMEILAKQSEIMESGIDTSPVGGHIALQTSGSLNAGNFDPGSTAGVLTGADLLIVNGARAREKAATDAAAVVDAQYREDQLKAWTQYYADLAKQEEQARKTTLKDIQRTFEQTFLDIFKNGVGAFGQLWDTIKAGFEKLAADMIAGALMKKLSGTIADAMAGAGMGGAGDASSVAGKVGAAITSVPFMAFAAGLSAIGSSILQTSAQNAEAARQFADANVKWKLAFDNLTSSFTDTSAQKQKKALDAQFQALMDQAISDAATAIKNSPAAKFGASGVGLFGSTTGTVPGAGTIGALDAYIAQLTKAQGTGKNVAQDRDLATLLDQLTKLDAQYKEQAAALAIVIAAQQKAFQSDLQVRQLTAEGDTADAARVQRQIDEAKQIKDAQDAGFDAATIAYLKQVQAEEDLKTATDAATAAQQAQADAAKALAAAAQQAANDMESLAVRDLRATGHGSEADLQALQDSQAQEMQAALDAHKSQSYIDLLKKTQADELRTFLAQQSASSAPAASSGAATAGAVSASASAGVSGAQTAVQSTVTERTAYQLVDIGRSQLTVLQSIDRGIRWLANGGLINTVNTGLATVSQGNDFLTGTVVR